jgi:hypothetical protein
MKPVQILSFTMFSLLIPATLFAAEVFESGNGRVSVLELYTSEGCSSCPPADRWLSGLKEDKRLWKQLIPVAFHVDYWNYIGWPDRFSTVSYSDRQRHYARGKGLSTVYTPGFLLNGQEWRSYFGLRHLSLDSGTDAGKLTVNVDQQTVQATYKPAGQRITKPVLNIAVLGFDLVTKVEAGENRNKQLKHDFTVLGYSTVPMATEDGAYSATTQLPEVSIVAPRTGLAVWINEQGDQTPIQATGGWLNNSL